MKEHNTDIALENRLRCALNKSLSKASFSFSRAKRFTENRKDMSFRFYNLPGTLGKRGTSLGYGHKSDFTENAKRNQSQQLYGFPSSFDPKYHNSPQYSFGTSKKKGLVKSVSVSPGPKYSLKSSFCDGAPSYSIGERFNDNKHNCNYPGPGAYFKPTVIRLGKYFNSKFRNNVGINLDVKEKRFRNRDDQRSPGPQAYMLPSLIRENGMIFESKFKSIPGRSFIGHRNLSTKKIDYTPGPGSYNVFSEFDGYNKK